MNTDQHPKEFWIAEAIKRNKHISKHHPCRWVVEPNGNSWKLALRKHATAEENTAELVEEPVA